MEQRTEYKQQGADVIMNPLSFSGCKTPSLVPEI